MDRSERQTTIERLQAGIRRIETGSRSRNARGPAERVLADLDAELGEAVDAVQELTRESSDLRERLRGVEDALAEGEATVHRLRIERAVLTGGEVAVNASRGVVFDQWRDHAAVRFEGGEEHVFPIRVICTRAEWDAEASFDELPRRFREFPF